MTHDPRESAPADPVFLAMERHRTAQEALNEAARALGDLEANLPFGIRRAPRVQAGVVETRDGSREPIWLHSEDEIERFLARWEGLQPPHAVTAKRIELRAGLASDAAILAEARERAGLTAAQDAYDRACATEDAALQALTRTVPTTAAGASAFAQYIVAYLEETEGSPARDEVNGATLATLERALTSLARVA